MKISIEIIFYILINIAMYFYGYFGFRNPEKIQQKIIKRNGQIANFFNI